MGRDRAKEKIQAHRKAKIERKKTKVEQRIKDDERQATRRKHEDQDQKKAGSGWNGDLNLNVAGDELEDWEKVYCTEGGEGESEKSDSHCGGAGSGAGASSSLGETSSDVSSSRDNANGLRDFREEGAAGYTPVQSQARSSQSSVDLPSCSRILGGAGPSAAKGKDFNIKSTKSTIKAFSSGNPNHRSSKPQWRIIHDEKLKERQNREHFNLFGTKAESSSSSIQRKKGNSASGGWNWEENLKPEELKFLREILDITKFDDVCPAVAAVALGRFDLIKKLLKEGQFTSKSAQGQKITPMGCAIISLNWEMIQFLLDKNINVHSKDTFGNTPLIKAALCPSWTENLMFDLWMMMKDDSDTNIRSSNNAGITLVHSLAYRGWETVLTDVLNFVTETSKEGDQTSMKAIVSSFASDGTTPLMIAVDRGYSDIAMMLLSKGASPIFEDKAGCSALCRIVANSNSYADAAARRKNGREYLAPALLQLVLTILDGEDYNGFEFESYIKRRIQVVTNPIWDTSAHFIERFFHIGRPVLLFIVRHIHKGAELLLNSKIFTRLSQAGYKHSHQADYIFTICLTIFEILVYAEDFPSIWSQYVSAFAAEGATDFCLKFMQRSFPVIGDLDSVSGDSDQLSKSEELSTAPSISEFSSKYPDFTDNSDNLDLEQSLPLYRNAPLAAMMSLIQLFDVSSPGLDAWISSNFQTVATCYDSIVNKNHKSSGTLEKFPSCLDVEHVDRTNRKVIMFRHLITRQIDFSKRQLSK